MKIIYHDPEGDVVYTRIARVDFSPEVDIKLNSLPVDMLTVDIITQDTLERGWLISLKNDVDTLFAKFKIRKVQRINKDTLRVEAQSPLGLLDWWTVGAERINTTAGAAVYDLFNGLPKSGYFSIVPYTLPTELASVNINGFAPEQTARERLLWLCLAMGAWVQQSFCNGLVFHALPDFSNHDIRQGTLLPYKRTYWKPETQLGDPIHVVWVELIGSISTTETPNTESGTDEGGTTYYWDYAAFGYTNPDEDAPGGSEVKITGISLLNHEYQQPTFSKLGALYMNRMEISAEIIDNGDVQPGDVVRVYTDEDLIYCGVVTQCVFTFGQQSKARLTVSAFSDELPIQIVRVTFTADDVPLGQETEVYPEGDTWEVDAPDIDGYTPDTPSITGSTGGNYNIDYTKIPLKYIVATNRSFTVYLEDQNISYENLLVMGYQTEKSAATQVLWTNGGQWKDGKIPFEALTLPVKKAIYDPTKPVEGSPGASYQTIPVQFIDDGTTFEDTFDVMVYKKPSVLPPASIHVITPPTKTTYEDGETIDYTGMVVKAYDENGDLWTNSTHPDGVIPIAELTLTQTAVLGENPHYKSEDETVFIDGSEILVPKDVKLFTPEPISYIDTTPNYRQYSFDEATEQSYAVILVPDNSNQDTAYVVNGDINYDGSNIHLRVATIWQTGQTSSGKFFRCYDLKASDKIYRSVSPVVQRDVWIQTTKSNRSDYLDGSGSDRYTPHEYTYDGRTVYWTTGRAFTFYDPPEYDFLYNYLVEPTEIAKTTIPSGYLDKMAWFMLYGDMQPYNKQTLEITFGQLSTTTDITVLGEVTT